MAYPGWTIGTMITVAAALMPGLTLASSPIDQCIPNYSSDMQAGALDPDKLTLATVYNNTGFAIYPVVRDGPGTNEYRIYGKLVPSTGSTTIAIPKTSMWQAGRILILPINPLSNPLLIPTNGQQFVDSIPGSPNNGLTLFCSNQSATGFPAETPAQLTEYTFIQGDNGYPVADYDVSYVDHLYLPIAMEVGGGAIGYMGSVMSVADMQQELQSFVAGRYTQGYFSPLSDKQYGWPSYRNNNASNSSLLKVPSGYNLLELADSPSSLFPGQSILVYQDPSSGQQDGDRPQVNGLVARWMGWLTPATVNATVGSSYTLPVGTAVNQIGQFNDAACQADSFCSAFSQAVNSVWLVGWKQIQSHYTKPITPAFAVKQLIGYNEFPATFNPTGPQYPWGNQTNGFRDTFKAILRGVPSLDPKYGSLWYPSPNATQADGTPNPNQKYSLDPFVWFVHQRLKMSGAYGFSIDDDQGNVQVGGSTIILTVGGPQGLPNTTPYNPNAQQSITFPPSWTSFKVVSGPAAGFLNTCHLATKPGVYTNCAISLQPGQTGTFSTSGANQTLTVSLSGVQSTAPGQPTILNIAQCQSSGNNLCQEVILDPQKLTLNLPCVGSACAGASSKLILSPGWASVSSSACPIAAKSDDGKYPANNIQGNPTAFSFQIPTGTSRCSLVLGRQKASTLQYVLSNLGTANPTATCIGCKVQAAPPNLSWDGTYLTIDMPPATAE
jgi:hypothetical protein